MSTWEVNVGSMANADQAAEKAKQFIDAHPGLEWTGGWHTSLGLIQVRSVQWTVEMGPIWNQQDAETKAANYIKANPHLRWTGMWKTTIPNQMSVIEVEGFLPDVSGNWAKST